MAPNPGNGRMYIATWHRNLLLAAAISTVLLIAIGGILCVTQSIRDCPDWPGCFGRVIPPAETGPVLEYTHRLLAAITGLLILGSAIAGLVRVPRLRLIVVPPIIAVMFLIVVSYFGAQVVLRGLSPGWAAVDVGSALLVEALMVSTAIIACSGYSSHSLENTPSLTKPFTRLVLATTAVVYFVLVSGILVAGNNFLTGCVGWPIYSLSHARLDANVGGSILRLVLSIVGVGMFLMVLIQAWKMKQDQPVIFRFASLVGGVFLLELLVQALLLILGFPVSLLVIYTVTAAIFWGLLAALLARSSLGDEKMKS